MKCIVLADLDLDLYLNQAIDPFSRIPAEQFEGITHCIIAGDLSNKAHKQWKRCLSWLADQFPVAKFFVMPGNHDYYDSQIDGEERLSEVAKVHNAVFVQKSELIFEHHRFLFATLWTDFEIYGDRAANMQTAGRVMHDYHYIRVARNNYRRLTPVQTAAILLEHRAWLAARLAEPFNGETTVITHHAPHRNALSAEPSYGPCYASDLEDMIIEFQPTRWLFGHTHHRIEFKIGDADLRNVSVGYPGQHQPIESFDWFILDLN
ncbi:MAG: metallophosphoesterase [Paracoccaceae bacterium]